MIWTKGDLTGDTCIGKELQSAFESVEGVVGLFGTEGTVQGCDERRCGKFGSRRRCLFDLEICFAGSM